MKHHSPNTYLVTGGTSGIGLALVDLLLKKRHRVIAVGRSPERCQEFEQQLKTNHPDADIKYLVADLSRQTQIEGLAENLSSQLTDWGAAGLDGLVNNAGKFTFWQSLTPDGFETQWAINYLAPFKLTLLMMPFLEEGKPGKVINISSGSHYGAHLDWNDLQLFGRYNPLKAYKRSKLAAVLFCVELRRRLGSESRVQVAAADPGLVNTGMGAKTGSQLAAMIWSRRRQRGISPEKSAAGILKLLLEIDLNPDGPVYWKHGKPKKPNPFALDPDHGRRLWLISSQMTGVP